ncbi:MAG: hypothetical protein ACREX8_12510 [Gammaproteobacteria bacterium]
MQHEIEHSRMTAAGKRTDDGEQCTLLVVHETGGSWVMYPHGWGKFGVRLPKAEAVRVARAILDGAE